MQTVSTIGEQKRFNYAPRPMSREEFKRIVTADQPEAPDYFVHDAILNSRERVFLDASMRETLKPLSLDELLARQESGAQVLDVRDGIDFEGGHLRGALNIALSGKYATWAGSMLAHDAPILVIADEGGEEEAVMRLGRIGFDNVGGYLAGGMNALAGRDDGRRRPQIGRIRGRPVIVHCEGGYRSAIAESLLQKRGRADVIDLVGGFKAWSSATPRMDAGPARPAN